MEGLQPSRLREDEFVGQRAAIEAGRGLVCGGCEAFEAEEATDLWKAAVEASSDKGTSLWSVSGL